MFIKNIFLILVCMVCLVQDLFLTNIYDSHTNTDTK